MHGQTVVVMPPKKGTPWKLQPKCAFQLDNTERVHDQNSSDSEDECGAMFEEMAQDHTEQLADVTQKASTFEEMLAAVAAAEKNNPSVGSSGFGSADLAFGTNVPMGENRCQTQCTTRRSCFTSSLH